MSRQKIEVIGVSTYKGIVTCINEHGEIEHYAMGWVGNLSDEGRKRGVELGLLDKNVFNLEEFPEHYIIVKEDPEIQKDLVMDMPKIAESLKNRGR